MSALNRILGLPDDPRELELIRGLIDKTKQGRIPWVKKQTMAFTAAIPNGLEMNFVLSRSLLAPSSTWELFTVRDVNGSELLRVTNPSSIGLLASGATASAVSNATNELFRVVYGAVGDDLDRAINTIKKL
jgi:hypothetical protein